MQWNVQGIRCKKEEILELIEKHKISILAIQETKITDEFNFRLPAYNSIRKMGHVNRTTHGGVALFFHSDIPYHQIDLQTPMQAVAASIRIKNKLVTICSLYSSQSHPLTLELLNQLKAQLPSPVLIMGDLNAYSAEWGSADTRTRGRVVEQFMRENDLNILNNGAPTRVAYQVETAVDVTICSPALEAMMEWSVYSSPGDSDHCPIIITVMNDAAAEEAIEKYNMKKAKWEVYKQSDAWQIEMERLEERSNEELLQDIYYRITQASNEAIPKYTVTKYFPRPWWTPELKKIKR